MHSRSVQFDRPEVSIEFDVDSAKAIATRQRIFAEQRWGAGAHRSFTGIGHVRVKGAGHAGEPVQ